MKRQFLCLAILIGLAGLASAAGPKKKTKPKAPSKPSFYRLQNIDGPAVYRFDAKGNPVSGDASSNKGSKPPASKPAGSPPAPTLPPLHSQDADKDEEHASEGSLLGEPVDRRHDEDGRRPSDRRGESGGERGRPPRGKSGRGAAQDSPGTATAR